MNCKPGDLAVLVRVSSPLLECNVGKLFTVLRWDGGPAGEWEVRAEQSSKVSGWKGFIEAPAGTICYCDDRLLRPIRPQPDDAVDEMVLRVGKPSEVTA